MSQSPLLHIPTKRTDEAELLTGAFRTYIANVYQDDPDKYATEIATLYRLRQDTRGAGKDITGRDILYRYYGQLELLDLRFPVDEKNVKILFTWYDAFSQKPTSQYSIAYEKASTIFNIAATCSSIGALQNRSEAEGLKLAFNYFQAAAGLFLYINDNFLHAPSLDLSRDSIKTLHDLMLAQAQECLIENTLLSKKEGALVSKLAAHASSVYQSVADGLSNETIKPQIDRAWIELTKVKVKYFQAMALYHKSIQSELDTKYGESVAYVTAAEALAKDANKMATAFAGSFPSFSVSTMAQAGTSTSKGHTTAAAAALVEATKVNLTAITERKTVATKDNDMIYHASVPLAEGLPPLPKLNGVKPTSFADLCTNGQADIAKIIGPDIFQKLVPLAVHESASLYSEEKAKLLRGEQARADAANEELQATLESLNLVRTLDKLKQLSKSPTKAQNMAIPDHVHKFIEGVQAAEKSGTPTSELVELLDGFKKTVREVLDEMGLALENEQHECEAMRSKFGDLWTQEPSGKYTAKMREDIRQHRDSFEKGQATDGLLHAGLEESKAIINILRQPRAEVEATFVAQVAAPRRGSQVANLIDGGDDSAGGFGILNEQMMIEKLDGELTRLRALKKERGELVEVLKKQLHDDDISSLLLLNKNKEKEIFHTELSKFKPLQSRLTANLHSHNLHLRDLANDFNKLQASSETIKSIDALEERKAALVKEWERAYYQWTQAKDGLNRGIQFYSSLGDIVESLRATVTDFLNRREQERMQMAKRLEESESERRQHSLREQLQRLNVAPAATSPGYAPSQQVQSPIARQQQSPADSHPPQPSPAQNQQFPPPQQQQQPQQPSTPAQQPASPYTFPAQSPYQQQNYTPQLPSSPPTPAGRQEVQPFAPPPPSPQAGQHSAYPFPPRGAPPLQYQMSGPPPQPQYQAGMPPPAPAQQYQTSAPPPAQYQTNAPPAQHQSAGPQYAQQGPPAALYQPSVPAPAQYRPAPAPQSYSTPASQPPPGSYTPSGTVVNPPHSQAGGAAGGYGYQPQAPTQQYGAPRPYQPTPQPRPQEPQYGASAGYQPAGGYQHAQQVPAQAGYGQGGYGLPAAGVPPARTSVDMQRPPAQPYGGPPIPPKAFAGAPAPGRAQQPAYGAPAPAASQYQPQGYQPHAIPPPAAGAPGGYQTQQSQGYAPRPVQPPQHEYAQSPYGQPPQQQRPPPPSAAQRPPQYPPAPQEFASQQQQYARPQQQVQHAPPPAHHQGYAQQQSPSQHYGAPPPGQQQYAQQPPPPQQVQQGLYPPQQQHQQPYGGYGAVPPVGQHQPQQQHGAYAAPLPPQQYAPQQGHYTPQQVQHHQQQQQPGPQGYQQQHPQQPQQQQGPPGQQPWNMGHSSGSLLD
ncbi:BRO1-like domain-containing protein [Geranomyces variabilis]|nr:BRO1-like domain-containing protein [Geranomyces variabilis]KAJ3141200.1 bck1-like resistance to osmotic shock [Geranomyces variabilis]